MQFTPSLPCCSTYAYSQKSERCETRLIKLIMANLAFAHFKWDHRKRHAQPILWIPDRRKKEESPHPPVLDQLFMGMDSGSTMGVIFLDLTIALAK